MGCCQSNIEIGEMILSTLDNVNLHDPRLTQTEDGFGDLSLDSVDDEKDTPRIETSKTRLGDSIEVYTRGKSISLHRTDFESAFLQSSGIIRKLSLMSMNQHN